jgi:hypothetical protein
VYVQILDIPVTKDKNLSHNPTTPTFVFQKVDKGKIYSAMFSYQSANCIVEPKPEVSLSSFEVMTSSSLSSYESSHDDRDDVDDMQMIFEESSYDDDDLHHHKERGVDDDFLNQLCFIANHGDHMKNDHCTVGETCIPSIPLSANNVVHYNHDYAVMIEDDDESSMSNFEPQSMSTPASPSSSCNGIIRHPDTGSTTYSLQAPHSQVNDFVNAYFVVDPVNHIVFFPKQTISCQINNRLETTICGPFYLPHFDVKSTYDMNRFGSAVMK